MEVIEKGAALRLRPRDSVREAAARALTLHFRGMLAQVAGVRRGVDPECLHEMRVNLRRLRAILRLFRHDLPPRATSKLAEELKGLGQSLGAVRDLDVHLQECSSIARRLPKAAHGSAERCRCEMGRRRERAHEALLRDLQSPRFGALEKSCRDLIGRLRRPTAAGTGTIAEAGATLMRAELKRILKDGRAIAADSPDEALHRLRVRCKRLRYACETLRDVYGRPVEKMARRLGALQDVLGAHQDAVAAQALIERALAESAATVPDGVKVAGVPRTCAVLWREEQRVRRAAFPAAWDAFDRKKARRAFLKAIVQNPPDITSGLILRFRRILIVS